MHSHSPLLLLQGPQASWGWLAVKETIRLVWDFSVLPHCVPQVTSHNPGRADLSILYWRSSLLCRAASHLAWLVASLTLVPLAGGKDTTLPAPAGEAGDHPAAWPRGAVPSLQ